MTGGAEILLYSAIGVAGYAVACNRLSAAVQPLRLRMAELGETLLQASDIPEEVRRKVDVLMDSVYDTSAAWIRVVILPALAVWFLWGAITGRWPEEPDIPPRLRDDFREFVGLAGPLPLFNSPLALALFLMQLAVLVMLFVPASYLLRGLAMAHPGPPLWHGKGHHA
jgi:hypothetical protein